MAAFSSAGQVRRRPAPVNTSMRRARSRIGVSSQIDVPELQVAPNFTLHAWLRKALPRRRLLPNFLAERNTASRPIRLKPGNAAGDDVCVLAGEDECLIPGDEVFASIADKSIL